MLPPDLPPHERSARLFDLVADTYDQVGVEFFGPIASGLVAALDVRPGERVADIGCGRGAFLLRAAGAVGPHGRVDAIDVSPAMVAAATAAATTADAPVVVSVGDAATPPWPPGTFDVVAASLVLFFLPDPALALAAWTALLVPDGRLGISTFGPQDEVWRRVDDLFVPYLPPEMADARTSGARGPFASDAGVEGLLRQAGLTHVRTTAFDLSVRFADADHWYAFSMSTGQRAMWAAVPEQVRGDLRRRAADLLEQARDPDRGDLVVQQRVRYSLGRRPA